MYLCERLSREREELPEKFSRINAWFVCAVCVCVCVCVLYFSILCRYQLPRSSRGTCSHKIGGFEVYRQNFATGPPDCAEGGGLPP